MRDFHFPPAFGWQTKEMNADTYYKNLIKDDKKKAEGAKNDYKLSNVAKIIGYVPGLGLGVGVGRIISVIKHKKDDNKNNHVARAIAEIFGMGPLLFLIDLAKHGMRSFKAKPAK